MKSGKLEVCTLLWTKYKSEAKEIAKFLIQNEVWADVPKENTQEQFMPHRSVNIFKKDYKLAVKLAKKFAKKSGIEIVVWREDEKCFLVDSDMML